MKIRMGAGVFTPRLLPTLLTLVMLPVLLGLGTWQVQRLHWKEALIKTIDERSNDAALEVPFVGSDHLDYRPAFATGVFHHDMTFFVFGSDITSGKGGYHVYTPLQLSTDGSYLLVDRGWVPYEMKDKPGGIFKQLGRTLVKGTMRVPRLPEGWLQPKNDPAKGYWYGVDLATMAAANNLKGFLPYVLEADATPNEGGFPIGGQTHLTLPNDHLSYAVTWYGFAAILLIVYVASSYRKDG